jgi:hypothetical protein
VVVAPVMVGLLACGGVDRDDDGAPPLAHHPQAQPGVAAPASGAAPFPGASSPPPTPPAGEPSRPPPPISPAVSPPPVVVPPPELFPSLAPTATPPPPPRPEAPPLVQPPPPDPTVPQPLVSPPPPLPPPPPPSPAEFAGFGCEPPRCVVHGVAVHPRGGFAVFRELFDGPGDGVRGQGVNELVDARGAATSIAPGVVVLRGEFDAAGSLHALVEPQWDSAAGALDTRVTAARAVVVYTPAGEVASVEEVGGSGGTP